MFYTIYQITNLIDGKIYIGKHKTKNLNDQYMGSGKHIKRAIAKHGIENFKKEILFRFDNEADMNAKEVELVTEEFCLRSDTYNLAVGGQGGFSYLDESGSMVYPLDKPGVRRLGRIATNRILAKRRVERLQTDEAFREEYSKRVSEGLKEKYTNEGHHWKGRYHTEETKQKMRKPKNIGSTNSQFGTMWITNGEEDKKIKKIDIIPEGWYKGRKKKHG
jgi:hypothetical protein